MFNNLIESTSHRNEYKRRGTFFLVTTASYALLLVLTGVASIYAYDAHLEDQTYQEIVTLLPVPEPPATTPAPTNTADRSPAADNNRSNIPERTMAVASVNQPTIVPDEVSAERSNVPPLPPGPVRIGTRNWDPPTAGGGFDNGNSGGTRIAPAATVILPDDPPPPPPQPRENRVLRISKVLNSQALSLPKPIYPPLAKQIRLQGTVNVQVLIDENGRVVSAQALGGPPMLITEAKKAALQARFSPTMIGDQAVKVSGVIVYNFVLQP